MSVNRRYARMVQGIGFGQLTYTPDSFTELLPVTDALVSVEMARMIASSDSCGVLIAEIGVLQGGWILTMLGNMPESTGIGVDPYPENPGMAAEVIARAAEMGMADRFTLFRSTSDFCDTRCLDGGHLTANLLIHIDGEHSEEAVDKDLSHAIQHAGSESVFVIDDFWNASFPGVMSATLRQVLDGKLRPFLTTRNKLYCVLPEDSESRVDYAIGTLKKIGLPVVPEWLPESGESLSYRRASTIGGWQTWQLLETPKSDRELRKNLNIPLGPRTIHAKVRGLTPPFLYEFLRQAKARISKQ